MLDPKDMQQVITGSEIDVYCDESYPDLLCSQKPQGRYMVIGSLWMLTENRFLYKKHIHDLREKHRLGRGVEFKWNNISRSRLGFYTDLLDWFVDQGERLRFSCIIVDTQMVDVSRYLGNNRELGFYTFYYHMLRAWIHNENGYNIFCDYKTVKGKDRLVALKNRLGNYRPLATIKLVQAVHSHESVLLQLNDVLMGVVAHKWNTPPRPDSLKYTLINHLETRLGREIQPTDLHERKFNAFEINLRTGD